MKRPTRLQLTAEQRKKEITASLAEFLGDAALEPVVYYESDWGSEEWTRGAYAASYDLGGLHRYGPDQLAPVGPIHWSCSDLAAEGYQHVDGAVRMGRQHGGPDRGGGRPCVRQLPSEIRPTVQKGRPDAVRSWIFGQCPWRRCRQPGRGPGPRQGATLDLVMVMPEDSPYGGAYPPEAGFENILAEQVRNGSTRAWP